MFPRSLIRMTICRNTAAHVFGTVSMTTERKLPPKTFNLNRRHMACEGPPGKKHKSINPLYTQTPLRWSFHDAQRASPGGTVKSYLLYTLHISSGSQTPFQTIWRTAQIYVLIIPSWRERRTHRTMQYSCKALWDICSSKYTYFLFDELRRLVVEDGPQAVSVCRGLRVQAEVECNEDGRQLIPEVLLILHTEENKSKNATKYIMDENNMHHV